VRVKEGRASSKDTYHSLNSSSSAAERVRVKGVLGQVISKTNFISEKAGKVTAVTVAMGYCAFSSVIWSKKKGRGEEEGRGRRRKRTPQTS